jgi:predicted phosphate transport protein (TIGR00153 family)
MKLLSKFPVNFPFVDITPKRTPFGELLEHYKSLKEGINLIPEALKCYENDDIDGFLKIKEEVDALESKADVQKRDIRNHMPKYLFMPVDRTIFFQLTRSQDNILDHGQIALNWLAIRKITIQDEVSKNLDSYLQDILTSVNLLEPVLQDVIEMINGGTVQRSDIKEKCRKILNNHEKVMAFNQKITAEIFAFEEAFKDTYQKLKFIEEMYEVSHNAERSSDMLRAMIAK